LRYSKKDDARYVGHLDVARFWERVFRRVELPIAYSQGFNPQVRMQFGSALPVGIAGENELLDLWLLERIDPEAWLDPLRRSLPPGFALRDITEVPLKLPPMQASLRFAVYEVRFGAELGLDELEGRVQDLLAEPEIIRPHHKKQGKTYDLRPLISDLDVNADNGEVLLIMKLGAGQQGNARASEVLDALGLAKRSRSISRVALLLDEPSN
jgi:radical SAM-linked protein